MSSSILSALAPSVSSNKAPEKKQKQTVNPLLLLPKNKIKLPTIAPQVYRLSTLLSQRNFALQEEHVAKREGVQSNIKLNIEVEPHELRGFLQAQAQKLPSEEIEVASGYRLLRRRVEHVGYYADSSESSDEEEPQRSVDDLRVEFNALQHDEWEQRVVWGDGSGDETSDDETEAPKVIEAEEEEDEEIDWDDDGRGTKDTSTINLPQPVPATEKWGEHFDLVPYKAPAPAPKQRTALTSMLNEKFASFEWLQHIVWDDTKFCVEQKNHLTEKKYCIDQLVFNGQNKVTYGNGGESLCMGNEWWHELIEDENDVDIFMRPTEGDSRVRVTGGKLLEQSEESVERKTEGKKKGRKTREEKAKGRDARLSRLRAMGLLFDEEPGSNKQAEGNSDTSLAWKTKLPQLPDAVRWQSAKAEMKPNDARSFHRPRTRYSVGDTINILLVDETGVKKTNSMQSVWKKKDLSARSGFVMLMEYSEELPPLLCNSGMSSAICNFYKPEATNSDNSPTKPTDIPELDLGLTVCLSNTDRSPFLASLEPKTLYPSLYTSLFMAPIFQHKVSQNDFLLVRPKRSAAQAAMAKKNKRYEQTVNPIAYLRKVNAIYLCGQTEPQTEVFPPSLTSRNSALRTFLHSFIGYHVLRKLNKNSPVTLASVKNMFPSVAEAVILKALKDVAERRDNGPYFVARDDAPDESDYRKQLPPQLICRYEATQAGVQRLYDLGILHSVKSDVLRTVQALQLFERFHVYSSKVIRMLKAASGVSKEKKNALLEHSLAQVRAGRFIAEGLQLTSWFITASYVNMHIQKGQPNNRFTSLQMRLQGLGDPSGRGEAVSYLPELTDDYFFKKKNRRKKKMAGDESDEEEEKKAKKGYGGTDFDLRKLSLPESAKLLRAHGIPQSQIELLDRWDRITVVESIASSTKHKGLGLGLKSLGLIKELKKKNDLPETEIFSKFARHVPSKNDASSAQVFQNKVNEIFKRQQQALEVKDVLQRAVSMASLDEDSDSDLDLVGDLESSLTNTKKNSTTTEQNTTQENTTQQNNSEENELRKLTEMINDKDYTANKQPAEVPIRIVPKKVQKVKRMILKRTTIETMANGELRVRVYFIKKKKDIDKFKSKQRKRSKETKETMHKIEHRLDASQLRQGSKRQEWYLENVGLYGRDWPLTQNGNGPRCTVCKLKGHSVGSRLCPLDSSHNNKNIKLKGLRVRIDRKELNKRKRPRDASSEDDDGGSYYKNVGSRSRRKKQRSRNSRKGAKYDLNAKLKEVHIKCARDRNARWFRAKVNRKQVPTYYDIIKHPMDLGTMGKKLDMYQYTSTAEFMNDMKQMYENAILFNGVDSDIPKCAENLLNMANQLVAAEQGVFDLLDAQVAKESGGSNVASKSKVVGSNRASGVGTQEKSTQPGEKVMFPGANPFMDDFSPTHKNDGGAESKEPIPDSMELLSDPGAALENLDLDNLEGEMVLDEEEEIEL